MANALSLSNSASVMHKLYSQENESQVSSTVSNPQFSSADNFLNAWTAQNLLDGNEVKVKSDGDYLDIRNEAQNSQSYQTSHHSSVVQISPLDPHLKVDLHDFELWERFSAAQTEMIVTKPGRRMFPGYRVRFSGMDPNARYCVLMDITSVDGNRYKFQHGEWSIAGRGEPQIPQRFYLHPTSPASGQQWMREIVSFHKVKLTNSCGNSADGKFLIHSMHRYQPRIHVVRTDDVSTLHLQPMSIFSFPQTSFITVTAYQNHEVTKLKVDNNPFARGFRTNGGKTKNSKLASAELHQSNQVFNFSQKRIADAMENQHNSKRWQDDSRFAVQNIAHSNANLQYRSHNYPSTVPPSGFQLPSFYPTAPQSSMPLTELDCNQFQQQQNYYYPNATSPDFSSANQYDFATSQTSGYVNTSPVASLNGDSYSPVTSFCGDSPTTYNAQGDIGSTFKQSATITNTSPMQSPNYQIPQSSPQMQASYEQASQIYQPNVCESNQIPPMSSAYNYQQAGTDFTSPLTSVDDGYFSTSLSDDVKVTTTASMYENNSTAMTSHAPYDITSATDVINFTDPTLETRESDSYNGTFNLNLLAQSATSADDNDAYHL